MNQGLVLTTREQIEAHQLTELRVMIDALLAGNQFYGERLREAGIGSGNELASLEDYYERVGFTTKSELVEDHQQHEPYGRNLTYGVEDYVRFHQTSGTTGRPMRWLDTKDSWGWMLGNWQRVYTAAGVGRADRVFFAFSFGPFLGFWTAFEAAAEMGCLCLPGGGLSSKARLGVILDNEATVLCCTPTYALRLGEVAREEGIDLAESKIKAIIVAGEPGGAVPNVREAIERVWVGAHVYDHHGMTEIGPASYQHKDEPNDLRMIEAGFIVEVVEPKTGERLEYGEPGELVVTNLGRVGMPLLRYRTGDYVQAVLPDEGSEDSNVILKGGIKGRTDDMVVVRGVNVFPSAVDEVMRGIEGVEEYQVRVHESSEMQQMVELEIRVEPNSHCDDEAELVREVGTRLRDALSLRVKVESAARGALPRFEMKANRWVKED